MVGRPEGFSLVFQECLFMTINNLDIQVASTFQKFELHHFTFIKDLHVLFLLTKRNPKRNFAFTEKAK